VIWVNMNTLRLEVMRSKEEALITKDRMRVDVRAEFYVRVKPTEEAIADAAQTLGQKTLKPLELKGPGRGQVRGRAALGRGRDEHGELH
jgi:uncharacterized membrane protein YqiK